MAYQNNSIHFVRRYLVYPAGSIQSVCFGLIVCFITIFMFGCTKDGLKPSPYTGKVKPPVNFLNIDPYPMNVAAGAKVTFYVSGLKGRDTSSFKFMINQEPAQVLSIVDSAVTVMVPNTASSGAGSIILNGQSYFGPIVQINGKVKLDPSFVSGSGMGSSLIIMGESFSLSYINDIIRTTDDSYIIVGNFINYSDKATAAIPINRIARISKDGVLYGNDPNKVPYFNTAGVENGIILTILPLNNGGYVLGGTFDTYGTKDRINNMTTILENGRLDTMRVELVNPASESRPQDNFAYVPVFNGGVSGGVVNRSVVALFRDKNQPDKIISIGNFVSADSFYYYRSTATQYILDHKPINQFVRMGQKGTLDLSYNMNPITQTGYAGTNGFIYGAVQLSNGKIVIAGRFTAFNGVPTGNIAMLADDGRQDASFNSGGTGADGVISSITYNPNTKRILLSGRFKNYNGKPAPGVVMLLEDGSIDPTFSIGEVTGGSIDFAAQLSSGKVLLTGDFLQYNGISRGGMVFLNQDGSFAYGYNNMGALTGSVNKMIEAPTSTGKPGIILVGTFQVLDNKRVGGIARLEVLP